MEEEPIFTLEEIEEELNLFEQKLLLVERSWAITNVLETVSPET